MIIIIMIIIIIIIIVSSCGGVHLVSGELMSCCLYRFALWVLVSISGRFPKQFSDPPLPVSSPQSTTLSLEETRPQASGHHASHSAVALSPPRSVSIISIFEFSI